MDWILTAGSGQLKKMINAYLPVVALLTIILILPVIFEWIAISYEGQKTRSGIDASITSRYFNYQVSKSPLNNIHLCPALLLITYSFR
jgi:hypothetical protein